MSCERVARVLVAALIVAGTPTPAVAEPPEPPPEVVVEGTRPDPGRQRTSARVYGSRELAEATDSDARQLLERTANASSTDGRLGFAIRGSPHDGASSSSRTPLAIVTVDDAVLPTYAVRHGPFSLWDLRHAAVHRGPRLVRRGPASTLGIVELRTADPTFDWTARSRLAYGEHGTAQAAVAGGGPLGGDFAFRVAVDRQRTDGSIVNTTRDTRTWDRREATIARATVLYAPADRPLSVRGGFTFSRFEGGQDLVVDDGPRVAPRVEANDASGLDYDLGLATLHVEWSPTRRVAVTSITTAAVHAHGFERDLGQTAAPDGVTFRDYSATTASQELRVSYADDDWEFVHGCYLALEDREETFGIDGVIDLGTRPTGVRGDVEYPGGRSSVALFSEVNRRLLDRVTLTAGTRIVEERSTDRLMQRAARTTDHGAANPVLDVLVASALPSSRDQTGRTDVAVLPAAGVTLDLGDRASFAYTFHRGWRAGGSRYRLATGRLGEYAPEHASHHEVTWRAEPFDDGSVLAVSAYWASLTDQQVDVQYDDYGLEIAVLNAGRSTMAGGEVELEVQPRRGLVLFNALGVAHTRFDEFVDEARGESYAGNRFPGAPALTASVGARYGRDLGLHTGADVAWRGKSFADPANRDALDAHTLVNAKLGWQWEHLATFIQVRNAFDVAYRTSRTRLLGTPFTRLGEPRTASVILESRWR